MNRLLFLPLLLLLLAGCQNQERELRLKQQETELAQRERDLQLRENALVLREQSVIREEEVLDSTRRSAPTDSVAAYDPTGVWAVRMNCIETDCPGSAIGDSKSELWEISRNQQALLVKATVKDKVVRLYSGTINGNAIELTAQHAANDAQPDAVITAQLQLQSATQQRLEGRREINRTGNCRIIYSLELTRNQPLTSPAAQ